MTATGMYQVVLNSKVKMQHRGPRLHNLIIAMALSFCVLAFRLFAISRQDHQHEVRPVFLDNPLPLKNEVPRNTSDLIAKLAAVTRIAANGSNMTKVFSSEKQLLWNKEHPCSSRREIHSLYSTRKSTHDIQINSNWVSILQEYAKLHRTCVLQMGNVTDFFLKRKHIEGCKFVVAGVSRGSGIGNKALSIVSATVYAVLTQRILLVPQAAAAPGVFCEPFEGSSWTVDPDHIWTKSKKRTDLWDTLAYFYKRVDARALSEAMIKPVYAVSTTENWDAQPEPRFFCDTEQAQYTQVQWINFRNNFYFVPKLFAVPSFRPLLEDIFPHRKVLTQLLRTVMLPCDPVWERVKQVHDSHFRHSDRLVGIQERYFQGKSEFDLLHTTMEENVVSCLLAEGLLPTPNSESQPRTTTVPQEMDEPIVPSNSPEVLNSLNVTTIFITSLYQSLADRLSRDYVLTTTESDDPVGVVQLTHEETQNFGVEVDKHALVEILCLSLTDNLVLTPQSTFGALAQGYGGLVPWFIDLRPETQTPCVRAQSAETCFQLPATKLYTCPHDVDVNGQFMTDVVSYLTDCNSVEKPFLHMNGIQLATD